AASPARAAYTAARSRPCASAAATAPSITSPRPPPRLLGILTHFKRLVAVETQEMYDARRHADELRRAPRPPLVVSH
ncbi:hypothetical protein CFC21_092914, partial [Triticum aestivum]